MRKHRKQPRERLLSLFSHRECARHVRGCKFNFAEMQRCEWKSLRVALKISTAVAWHKTSRLMYRAENFEQTKKWVEGRTTAESESYDMNGEEGKRRAKCQRSSFPEKTHEALVLIAQPKNEMEIITENKGEKVCIHF
jgi:hypothetical protein